MKVLKIKIALGNAAFDEAPGAEVKRILQEIIDNPDEEAFVHGGRRTLRDINGNPVGTLVVREEE